jgi:hypothetical protein
MATLSIIAVYWLMLVLGMATCLAMRSDAPVAAIGAIWTGTVAGTVIGHGLALLNVRTWFALVTIFLLAVVLGPTAPRELSGSTLWLAFVPAAACAFWSLGDRTTLVAFWYPAVIWMLSILDHASPSNVPDDIGLALLGVLALLFLLFLRARETRRVALWRSVAPMPTTLAHAGPTTLLKERSGLRIARTGWALTTSALAFAATAWLAPRLWRAEQTASTTEPIAAQHETIGLPCCPVAEEVELPQHRVKEYFAIGRSHAKAPVALEQHDCRRCDGYGPGGTQVATGIDVPPDIATGGIGTSYADSPYVPPALPARGEVASGWTPPVGTLPAPVPQWDPTAGEMALPSPPPTQNAPELSPPPSVAAASPPPLQISARELSPPPPTPPSSPAAAPTTSGPSPGPTAAQHHATTTSTTAASGATSAQHSSPPPIGRSMLQWLAVLLGAALLMQLGALALRPVRRLVTLRHLRDPFWKETVDQRVSNAWQLALVGLRDAGWRPDGNESPRELAKRVGVSGVERCASILERAQHGVGIDADDLETMTDSAQAAYQDARSKLGPVARAATWLRWPLI